MSYSDPYGLCPDPNDPKCEEGDHVFSLSYSGFAGVGKGQVTPTGFGLGGSVGVAVDNKWNAMLFATGGLTGTKAGAASALQVGVQSET